MITALALAIVFTGTVRFQQEELTVVSIVNHIRKYSVMGRSYQARNDGSSLHREAAAHSASWNLYDFA